VSDAMCHDRGGALQPPAEEQRIRAVFGVGVSF